MKQHLRPEYFTEGKWTIRDLIHFIHDKTGRRVPYSTIKRWRKHLDIGPDIEMLYTDCDLDGLVSLAQWLSRGGKVKLFSARFKQFIQTQSEVHHG